MSCLKAGDDVLMLQRILGHTSLRMVYHDVHLAYSAVVARHRRHSPVDRLQLPLAVNRVSWGQSGSWRRGTLAAAARTVTDRGRRGTRE